MTAELSFTEVFAQALRGAPTTVADPVGGDRTLLPVSTWAGPASPDDHALLDLCAGATLDVGCGPGRLAAELTRRGHRTLGVDVVAEAVRLTRSRGARAMQRDVFGPLPREGTWDTVLLADGNVGIGGDPIRLLRRVRELLAEDGRVLVDVDGPNTGSYTRWRTIEGPDGRSRPFRWAHVSIDDVESMAAPAGLSLTSTHRLGAPEDPRWAVVLDVTR